MLRLREEQWERIYACFGAADTNVPIGCHVGLEMLSRVARPLDASFQCLSDRLERRRYVAVSMRG